MAVTCTAHNDIASVLLEMDYTAEAGTQTGLIIRRSVGGEPFSDLVGYGLLCEQGYYWDTTMPLDVPVTYQFETTDGIIETCTVTVDGGGFVWLKDPGRPWANVRLDLCLVPTPPADPDCAPPEEPLALIQFGDEVRPADANLFPILDQELPVDVYARRKGVTTSIQFASRTCEAIDLVYQLFTAGGPILIQAPEIYCWPDRFWQPGDLEMEFISRDQRKPWRLWSVPLTQVVAPAIDTIQGVEDATWCCVNETYATYADFTATGLTWGEVASREAC